MRSFMPELPEIETIKQGISKSIGNKITNIIIRNPNLRLKIDYNLTMNAVGQTICSIERKAKYLILNLDQAHLIIHLGMSGSLQITENFEQPIKKHDHVDIISTNYLLRFNDPRRFGLFHYSSDLNSLSFLQNLGVEPLTPQFTASYLLLQLKNKTSGIKQLLMNNKIVVGIGNIYACEALFLAKINPLRSGNSLTLEEINLLVPTIKELLIKAIALGGSSLKDYKQADGNLGYFQQLHQVYSRSKKPCLNCNSLIREQKQGGRNTFYCPQCQI